MRRTGWIMIWCAVVLMVIGTQPAQAKLKKLGQAGFKFLSNPVGARGAALGNAYSAMADGISAIYWNPAGLARLDHAAAFFDGTRGIADINYFAGAAAYNAGDYGVFGLSAVVMDYGDFYGTRRDPLGGDFIETGTFSPTAFAIGVSYARTMTDRFGFGATVKWARVDYGSAVSSNVDVTDPNNPIVTTRNIQHALNLPVFDVGVMYYTHIKGIRFGAAFRNFSQEKEFIAQEFSLPLELTFAGAVDVVDLFSLHGLGANHAATFGVDFKHSRDFTSRIHYGTEYWYRGALALRGGFKSNYDQEDFTFGAGVRGTMQSYAVQFDYSFNDYGVFDPVHKATLSLEF